MLCHDYQCVFVHIPKAAGQSVTEVFLDLMGLTWKTRAPLLLTANDRPELGPPRLAHLKAREYVACKHMTQEQFDAYFTFTFVRNPWDRAVSLYKYLGNVDRYSFTDFLSGQLQEGLWAERYWFVGPQYDFVFGEDGKQLVDFVGRFESLQADFDRVCERLGLEPRPLPHTNPSKPKDRAFSWHPRKMGRYLSQRLMRRRKGPVAFRHYTEYYDPTSRGLVERLYEKDVEAFGYRFGE